MRRIEIHETLCDLKEKVDGKKEWCPFLAAGPNGIPADFACVIDPDENERHGDSIHNIKRLAFCRREFPNGVIEIRAGK